MAYAQGHLDCIQGISDMTKKSLYKLAKKIYHKFGIFKFILTGYSTITPYFQLRPIALIRSLSWYIHDYFLYVVTNHNPHFSVSVRDYTPCLSDKTELTEIEPTYFYQDAWAAKKVFEIRPKHHVDVGSSVKTIGIISQFVPTTMVDIRPLRVTLPELAFVKGSILDLPFKDNSLETISSICVVEHIGLGRYGDSLDPYGSEKAIAELQRVVKIDGYIIMSVPIDTTSKIFFNAHRTFTPKHIIGLFKNFELVEENYIYGYDVVPRYVQRRGFGTGLYLFRKRG